MEARGRWVGAWGGAGTLQRSPPASRPAGVPLTCSPARRQGHSVRGCQHCSGRGSVPRGSYHPCDACLAARRHGLCLPPPRPLLPPPVRPAATGGRLRPGLRCWLVSDSDSDSAADAANTRQRVPPARPPCHQLHSRGGAGASRLPGGLAGIRTLQRCGGGRCVGWAPLARLEVCPSPPYGGRQPGSSSCICSPGPSLGSGVVGLAKSPAPGVGAPTSVGYRWAPGAAAASVSQRQQAPGANSWAGQCEHDACPCELVV